MYSVADFEGGNKNKRGIFTTSLLQRFIVEASQYFWVLNLVTKNYPGSHCECYQKLYSLEIREI